MASISVIIPVKNGEATLARCLQAITTQTINAELEIIVLDSASTDNSVAIAKSHGATVVAVDPKQFNHGLTRNMGARLANGSLLYYTVQDAELATTTTLADMTAHFRDAEVQAVVGIQGYPSELDKNPALWFKRFTEPEVETRHFPNETFTRLSPKQQFELSNWDDVNAMYRKEALVQIPFKETNYCEDWLWANDALKAGMKILRDPSLLVYHYHHMTFWYTLQSKFIINYYFYQCFKQEPQLPVSILPFLRTVYTLLKRREVTWFKKPYWIMHNATAQLANFLSVALFKNALLMGGENGLKKTYLMVCKKVPQGSVRG